MKLSAYGYLFNARRFDFDLDGMVTNFTAVFDETVIATIPSEDDTFDRLVEWEHKMLAQYGYLRLKVLRTDIKLSSNRFDGDLKTAALKACTQSTSQDPRCYVIMDGDEKINPNQRHVWRAAGIALHASPDIDGILIPVIDLIGDEQHARGQVGVKFRMHKDTVVRRGVIPQAELGDGLFDTTKSDSTEPLLASGQLARFVPINLGVPLYVFHYGHLDKERRAKLNREFWREHWRNRSGQEPSMALEADKVEDVPVVEHGLELP